MNSETVYVKVAQITEVYEPNVQFRDVAQIHCQNPMTEEKIKALKITSFQNTGKRGATYIGSVMDLLKQVEQTEKNIQLISLGETDFVVRYHPNGKRPGMADWMKTAVIAIVSFCGAAFAIMTFNNDSNVTSVFANLYQLITGMESDGVTVLELSYSLGLTGGILLFFNHFASWKITVDPTPLEVEMRLYEENLNKALIQNNGRKEKQVDVS